MYEKVFVIYPRGVETGGPEALHQLVDSLRRQGVSAWLVPGAGTEDRPRVARYHLYDAPEAPIEESPLNAVVAPEIYYKQLSRIRQSSRFCWWLSIDNSYLFEGSLKHKNRQFGGDRPTWQYSVIDPIQRARSVGRQLLYRMDGITHLTQSMYAWSFLYNKLKSPPTMLSDYTPDLRQIEKFNNPVKRNAVTYNWAKTRLLAHMVAEAMPEADFVPIKNMSRTEVYRALGSNAVYMDLGHHPGKDRMPREAAIAGAVVIVAQRGSAAFFDDVPLVHELKVSGDQSSIVGSAVRSLKRAMRGSTDTQQCMKEYRAKIMTEEHIFHAEVKAIFLNGLRGYHNSSQLQSATPRSRLEI